MTAIITLIDNLHEADGQEVRADHTIKIVWQVDDGEVQRAELDLTEAHTGQYLAVLKDMTKHANPAVPPRLTRAIEQERPQPRSANPGLAASKKRRGKMRRFVDEYQIRRLDGIDIPACETQNGDAYWPVWLDTVYEHYVETGEVILPATMREFTAANTGISWKSYIFEWSVQDEPHRVLTGMVPR